MKEYHKIQSLFKRDHETNKFTSEFTLDEFAYLFANEWIGSEKVDGTNLRLGYVHTEDHTFSHRFTLKGRTDKAQLSTEIYDMIFSYVLQWNENGAFFETFNKLEEGSEIVLYGEGYGKKIQKPGKRYKSDGVDFILFDVKIGKWWLKREDVVAIGETLGLDVVPEVFRGSLPEAMDLVKYGFKSRIAEDETLDAEGLVLTPTIPLFSRNGGRIITKLKTRDFIE